MPNGGTLSEAKVRAQFGYVLANPKSDCGIVAVRDGAPLGKLYVSVGQMRWSEDAWPRRSIS